MAALISLFIILTISLLITRIATLALIQTGLSRGLAQFQARSAFTGVGFTTNESEKIVTHPVRRRIVMLLMLFGNAGIVTVISSLLLAFINSGGAFEAGLRLLIMVVGLVVLWFLATRRWANRQLSRLIQWALQRWTKLDIRDYTSLLRLSSEYSVTELLVKPGDWLAEKRLSDLRLRREGVIVLGILRANGHYIGAPRGNTAIGANDTLIIYGRTSILSDLDERRANLTGERAHQKAVAEQQRVLQEQDDQE